MTMVTGKVTAYRMYYIFVQTHRALINSVAAVLGVRPTAIAGAITEESRAIDYTFGGGIYTSRGIDYYVDDRNLDILRDHSGYQSSQQMIEALYAPRAASYASGTHIPKSSNDDPWDALGQKPELIFQNGAYDNPLSADAGPGSINLGYAIYLLKKYIADHPNDDPLNLKQYQNDYIRYLENIAKNDGALTVVVGGLVVKDAQDFYLNHPDPYVRNLYLNASPQEQDRLIDIRYRNSASNTTRIVKNPSLLYSWKREGFDDFYRSEDGPYVNYEGILNGTSYVSGDKLLVFGSPSLNSFPEGGGEITVNATVHFLSNGSGKIRFSLGENSANLTVIDGSGQIIRNIKVKGIVYRDDVNGIFIDPVDVTSIGNNVVMSIELDAGKTVIVTASKINGEMAITIKNQTISITPDSQVIYSPATSTEPASITISDPGQNVGQKIFLDASGNPSAPMSISVDRSVSRVGGYTSLGGRNFNPSASVVHVGDIIGSSLGNYLANGEALKGIVYSSVLGQIGKNLAGAAQAASSGTSLLTVINTAVAGGLDAFVAGTWQKMQGSAIGTASSALAAELAQSLGLEGFGGQLFSSVATSGTNAAIQQVITNLNDGIANNPFQGVFGDGVLSSGGLWGSSIGGFLGAKLGAILVRPETEAGAVLSTIGSTIGSFVGMSAATLAAASSAAASTMGIAATALASFEAVAAAGAVASSVGGISLSATTAAAVSTSGLSFSSALIATGWGALVGFVIGALIGNLFGKKKPRTPTANAETVLQIPYAQYALGSSSSANGGNINLVTAMASNARDILNGLITQITFGEEKIFVSNVDGFTTTQIYGHNGNQLYVKINGATHNVSSADEAVEYGALTAIRNTKIVGGNLFLKRAILNSPSNDLFSLSGDFTTAYDLAFYGLNRKIINGFIKDAFPSSTNSQIQAQIDADKVFYTGANKVLVDKIVTEGLESLTSTDLATYNNNKIQFDRVTDMVNAQTVANPWIITLLRASELGLDKWAPSDFYGGLKGFIDSFDLTSYRLGYENISFNDLSGWNVGITATGNGAEGLFDVMPTSTDNGRTVVIHNLPSTNIGYQGGYTSFAHATGGNDILWASGANGESIDDYAEQTIWVESGYWEYGHWTGYDYEDQWIDTSHWETQAVSGGDDIFNGGQGNDTLNGRAGWDWLNGKDGHDVIFGGDGNDVLIGGAGNDHLDGQGGDDYIAAGDGGDGAYGGDGNDILVDGQGSECLIGQNGDDTFLIVEDQTFNWFWGGDFPHVNPGIDPNGKDTISAERLSVGVSFDIDGHPADWTPSHPDPVASNPAARAAFVVNAQTGAWITSEGLFSIENATGSQFADVIYGTTGDNVLKGLAGDDKLYGREGNDTIEGGGGGDKLFGGAGFDYVSYHDSSKDVYVDLSTGETYYGDAEGDILAEFEGIKGSRKSDELKGNASDNIIQGDAGDDWIRATDGNDTYDGELGSDIVDFYGASSGVTALLGSYSSNTVAYGSATGGFTGSKTLVSIENVVGSIFADTLSGGQGGQSFEGSKGNDTLNGGDGLDVYYFSRGDGQDSVNETNSASNTLSLASDIKFSDLYIASAGGGSGFLDIGIRGTNDKVQFAGNFADSGTRRLQVLDMNGLGQLDLSGITYEPGGRTDGNDTVNGWANQADFALGFNGNDYITGSGNSWEQSGNVFIGGLGDDTLKASVGDDQFAYDRGEGYDGINDSGGEDTIVFGATVAANDVIFQVVGWNLYVGLRDVNDSTKQASQVADKVVVLNGGVIFREVAYYDPEIVYSETHNTTEFVIAGGATIDLRKLNIEWTVELTWNYGDGLPIALDLDGDGLNLSSVEDSDIIVKTKQGGLSRLSWVGPTDGFLAVDRDGDGSINKLSEISFAQDKVGAKSDLEGLKTWDTNGDNLLDKNDLNFNKILLWQDINQNGRSTKKELKTLTEAGIAAIDLKGVATGYTTDLTIDSFVQNTMKFIWADGSKGDAYDVALARRVLGSEGLYSGTYQAEWGARDEDGVLGVLRNDPKALAKAERIAQNRGLLDKIGASYQEIKAKAEVDFSDNDKIDARIAKRWEKKNQSERAAWLAGQATVLDDKIKLTSADQALRATVATGTDATKSLLSNAQQQASANLIGSGTASANSAPAGDAAPAGSGLSLDQLSLGLALSASEPDAGVGLSTAPMSGSVQPWWQTDMISDTASSGNSLSALLSSMDSGIRATPTSGVNGPDQSLTQQQLLLLQAMAGFGGNSSGGSTAATWSRDLTSSTVAVAASSALTEAKSPALV